MYKPFSHLSFKNRNKPLNKMEEKTYIDRGIEAPKRHSPFYCSWMWVPFHYHHATK